MRYKYNGGLDKKMSIKKKVESEILHNKVIPKYLKPNESDSQADYLVHHCSLDSHWSTFFPIVLQEFHFPKLPKHQHKQRQCARLTASSMR